MNPPKDATKPRRKRFATPKLDPKLDGSRAVITDLDRLGFNALAQHRQLPATYLHLFMGKTLAPKTPKQKQLSQIIQSTTQRLSQLRNHGYLARPDKQRSADNNKGQVLTYDLTKKGEQYLKDRDKWSPYASSFDGHPTHQFALSCLTAGMHLGVLREKKFKVEYLTKEEIFAESECEAKKLELIVDGHKVKPDDLNSVRFLFSDRTIRFNYIWEVERALKSNADYKVKFGALDKIIRDRVYRKWGLKNLRVLIPTVSQSRIDLIKRNIQHLEARDYFLFQIHPFMVSDWEVPPVLYSVYEDPWQAFKGPFRINSIEVAKR
jgi:hypothetical protein